MKVEFFSHGEAGILKTEINKWLKEAGITKDQIVDIEQSQSDRANGHAKIVVSVWYTEKP